MKYQAFDEMRTEGTQMKNTLQITCSELTELEKKALLEDLKNILAKEVDIAEAQNKENEAYNKSLPGETIIQGQRVAQDFNKLEIYDRPVLKIDEQINRVNAEIEVDARDKNISKRIEEALSELGWK